MMSARYSVLFSTGDTCLVGEVPGKGDGAVEVIYGVALPGVSFHGGYSFSFSFRASVFPSPCDYMIAKKRIAR